MPGNLKHSSSPSTELLGFPPGARVLIVNDDDFGMYHAISARYSQLLAELPMVLSKWRCTPGLGNAEAQAWAWSGHTTQ
jgi:hypothetical protein